MSRKVLPIDATRKELVERCYEAIGYMQRCDYLVNGMTKEQGEVLMDFLCGYITVEDLKAEEELRECDRCNKIDDCFTREDGKGSQYHGDADGHCRNYEGG